MAAGLASLVSDIPANRQLIDPGVHGLTVPFGDETSIGEALLKLSGDPETRKRMGEAARSRVVENYSTNRVVERYETLLSEVMASRSSA
jgi:glycosyltransferase involved in cell wall biosynthesis